MESKIVTAIGVSVNTVHGADANRRIEKAVNEEILKCNEEGISTEEKNSSIIRERMAKAHQRVLAEIEEELRKSNEES